MFESAILNLTANYGVLGLGWVLFLYMMVDRRFERKEYSKLVMRIIDFYAPVPKDKDDFK